MDLGGFSVFFVDNFVKIEQFILAVSEYPEIKPVYISAVKVYIFPVLGMSKTGTNAEEKVVIQAAQYFMFIFLGFHSRSKGVYVKVGVAHDGPHLPVPKL
jgi:hypothetical protein